MKTKDIKYCDRIYLESIRKQEIPLLDDEGVTEIDRTIKDCHEIELSEDEYYGGIKLPENKI